jgi:hypothetical protein
MVSGTNPVSILWEKSKCSTFLRPSKRLGKMPVNEFELTSNTAAFPSMPISVGKHPPSLLFVKTISFKVFPILPMVCGMQPVNLLLAKTATETGEFPRVSGIVDVNRLSFKNKASRSLLKSSGGNSPSKSLYLRSRYLSAGIDRTTGGNGPTNRLLLTSSSWRSLSLEKLFGMIPQKRFELMWKRARSVIRPNSTGRYPAMSARLISTPATTLIVGSSKAGAQKTPLYAQTFAPTQLPVVLNGSEYIARFHAWRAM